MNATLPLACVALLAAPLAAQDDHQEPRVRQPLPSPDQIAQLPPDGGPEFNRLVFESSPYLLQHARNPVDWHPWGEEAFRAAKAQNKPVLLSIGYSTCHWCHVMEHESFEDRDVAALLNEGFIAIKVDREERPDLDHIYMTVTQAMNNGSGGWPMTVIMTGDRRPFFAGTYFPKTGRYGRPGFVDILQQVSEVWRTRNPELLAHADQVTQALGGMVAGTSGEMPGLGVLESAFDGLAQRFDAGFGGFGNAPKFPVPHNLRFLLRHHARTGQQQPLTMVEVTLQAMRKGGVFDQVGFGFHRYSTDRQWLVPHFEKMLYDQALLVMAYLEAYQVTGKPEYERTAREVLAYVSRDMTSPAGGFYSAEDADSEGEEGLFYLWTVEQLQAALEPDDAAWAIHLWNATEAGNFNDEASGERNGGNILHLTRTPEELAAERGVAPAALLERMERVRQRLFEVREPRVHPLKDDKILTDWNGLMIAAYAQAARVLDDEDYAAAARRATDHLLSVLRREDGRLYKLARLGQPAGTGMLEDYAFAIWGLLEVFETMQDPRDLAAARALADLVRAHFLDEEAGGFFLSPDDGEELIVRPKEIYDGAIPSGNSVAAWVLQRLGRVTGQTAYEDLASGTLTAFAGDVRQRPSLYAQLLLAVDFAVGPSREIVIVGAPGAEDTRAMLAAVHGTFAPNKVVLFKPLVGAEALEALAPYIVAQTALEGRATAYVCENYACQAPTTDPAAVRAALTRQASGGAEEEDGE